jgi:hypothetical protein
MRALQAIYPVKYNALSLQHMGNSRQTTAFICPVFQFTRTGMGKWLRAVVLLGGTNGGELSKTSGKARRALELLVDQGSTKAYLGAYLGFTDRMLFPLAQAGLITTQHEIINTGAFGFLCPDMSACHEKNCAVFSGFPRMHQ